MKWILVKDKLPEASDLLLVTCYFQNSLPQRYSGVARYDGKDFITIKGSKLEESVVAWMYLPEPYHKEVA